MDSDVEQAILSRKITIKRRGITPYARVHAHGESAYDFAAAIKSQVKFTTSNLKSKSDINGPKRKPYCLVDTCSVNHEDDSVQTVETMPVCI